MVDLVEDVRNNFKIKLPGNLKKTAIVFLNQNGDNIYIDIDDNSNIVGIINV